MQIAAAAGGGEREREREQQQQSSYINNFWGFQGDLEN